MPQRTHVLVVGTGSIGERHVRCFQMTGRAEVAIVEPLAERRLAVAEKFGVSESFKTLESALEVNRGFDAAVICTPADHHVGVALDLARRNVNLLIEKPLSTSLKDVDSLRRIVAERRLTAGVAYVLRHHPSLREMRTAIHRGDFGRPVQLIAVSGQHFPTYRPAYRQIYYADRDRGGGAVQDALTHIVNAAQWLVGPVQKVAADTAHQLLPGVVVEDTVHVLTRHGPVLGSFSLNQHQAPNEITITVVCEKGTARFEFHENRWRWMSQPGGTWTDRCACGLNRDDLFLFQAAHFLDALQHSDTPACSLPDAAHTVNVARAILAAAETHSWQDLPVTECTGQA